ncbi:MAG: hypothetical protein IPH44_11610 [Myxococcales bacterium]|nr:hypothetical protein [Myxococcales bacterium]
MPRSTRRDTPAATPESIASAPTREARLTELLAKLARRAGTWGWLTTYERIRRGEVVPRWHVNMTRLTAAKRCGELRPPEGINDE